MSLYKPIRTRELTNPNQENAKLMLEKLRKDPDKFERMFAAQYLTKYNFSKYEEYLEKAVLYESDPEVVHCIDRLLKENRNNK